MISQINLIKEDEKYIRTLINNIDSSSYELVEIIEDIDGTVNSTLSIDSDFSNPWSELVYALENLQEKITDVQEHAKWI